MPRNSNGTYTLPAGNPVVSGEVISTSWANPTMEDLANEITNSLDRSGRGGMMAPFKNYDGTQSSPGITWGNEPTTGFWRNAAQDMRVSVGGQPRMRWDANGSQVWNGTIWSPVVSEATLDPLLAAKGYAQKAANETISGAWSFSNALTVGGVLTVSAGGAAVTGDIVSRGGAYGMLRRDDDTTRLLICGGVTTSGGVNPRIDLNSAGYSSTPGAILLTPATGANAIFGGSVIVNSTFGLTLQGGNLSVTGNGTFSGTGSFGTNISLGGGTSAGEKAVKFSNTGFTNSIELLLNSGGDTFGFFRRDTNVWLLQYTIATSTFTMRTDVVVSGTLNASNGLQSGGVQVVRQDRTVSGTNSVTGGGDLSANRTFQLSGDVASPGSSWYYGTNASGTKGWFPLSGVVGVPEAPVDGTAYARQDASWVSIGSGGVYVLKTGDTMSGALTITNNSTAGALRLSSTRPSLTFTDTDQAADAKSWQLVANGTVFVGYLYDDAITTGKQFFSVTRNVGVVTNVAFGNNTDYPTIVGYGSGSFGKGFSRQPTATSDKTFEVNSDVGRVELTARVGDGTTNPRVGLFADASGNLGLNLTFSTSVTRFQFQWAGQEAYSYSNTNFTATDRFFRVNKTGSNAYGYDLSVNNNRRWFIGVGSDANNNRFEIDRYDASGVYQNAVFQVDSLGGVQLGTAGQATAIAGSFSVAQNSLFTGFIDVRGNFVKYNAADFATAASFYRDTSTAQGIKLWGDGSYNNVYSVSSPGNAKGMVISATTDESNTAPTAGTVFIDFLVRGGIKLKIAEAFIESRIAQRLINVGMNWYDAGSTTYQALQRNATTGRLIENDNGTLKGALIHWDSSTLPRGNIEITTTAPTANDAAKAGVIVFVYE